MHHPHAVQFMGACTKQQPYMLVTEFMAGGSVSDLLRYGRRVSVRRGLEIAMDTARGLAYMHCRKPQVRRGSESRREE
jgi:serine/threonine protein kinase